MKLSPFALALAAVLSVGPAVQAQSVTRTPLDSPLELTGQSGGRESSACGNIDRSAGQVIEVTESFASLSFEVESEGDYTLLITGPDGFRECVFAHNYDGGVIQAPGLLNQGEYKVFVGDRSGESHPYTMSITQ
ncbi:MAG: hypothetical protein AAFP20_14490 [Cyanobacteria bacterium J06614_10]